MAKKKKQTPSKVTFLSPIGIAVHPKLTQPDTTGQYADGKYKTKLRVSPDAKGLQEYVAFLKKSAHELLPGYEEDELKYGFKIEDDGNYLFSFKSKFAPAIIDPKNNPINLRKLGPDFRIGGGSKLRIAGVLWPYEGKDDDGVSQQMNQVQLLKLVAGRDSMFEAVDDDDADFDAEAFAAENAGNGTEDDSGSSDNGLGI